MITKKRIWGCLAAHGKNIKDGRDHGWRCSFTRSFTKKKEGKGFRTSKEIPLRNCIFLGHAGPQNFRFTANPNGGSGMEGVIGWIEFFGDAVIDDGDVLRVTLRDPKKKKS